MRPLRNLKWISKINEHLDTFWSPSEQLRTKLDLFWVDVLTIEEEINLYDIFVYIELLYVNLLGILTILIIL